MASGLAGAPGLPGPEAAQASPGQLRRLPASRNGASQGQPGPMGVTGHSGVSGLSGVSGCQPDAGPAWRPGPGIGPQRPLQWPAAGSKPGYARIPERGFFGFRGFWGSGGVSLSDAVQAAHEEGQEFGGSVARDAPALWLEAVLARKPRMPSDLEARLLQGSALPIDFLLHDEVRHALRRGFWDALERTRR